MFLKLKDDDVSIFIPLINLDYVDYVKLDNIDTIDPTIEFYGKEDLLGIWMLDFIRDHIMEQDDSYSYSKMIEDYKNLFNKVELIIKEKNKYPKSMIKYSAIECFGPSIEHSIIFSYETKVQKEVREELEEIKEKHESIHDFYQYGFYQSQWVFDTDKETKEAYADLIKLLKAVNQIIEVEF